ncbi:hypothetical protein BurJ1DRAFT_0897 [Burkholderiales bacterium JOSHI_001]|nr:hypothetical protein BurJ1DRAFT_0897 [Burkholderiales bacterium JOSHI_001]
MRLAFVSCMCTELYPDQPVWDWISSWQPDHLVLLGDSVYLDVPIMDGQHPKDMTDDEFARHLFARYGHLLSQPRFRALVHGLPAGRVWSVWDDHDFLWNDALGAEARSSPAHAGKVRLSTAYQEAFRRALAQGLAVGSFPSAYNDAVFWDPQQLPLTTPSVALVPGVWLHLADVRTWRTRTWLISEAKRHLLGAEQRLRLGEAMAQDPSGVHLLASGSTLASYKRHYPKDWQWMLSQAANARTLVLSGDIHRNESDAYFTGGLPLHEATSSGAAVRDAVVAGARRRNFGLLDIDELTVRISLFADDKLQQPWSRVLDRSTWLPIS